VSSQQDHSSDGKSRGLLRVWRKIRVKGSNVISIKVKVVLRHQLLIACEPVFGLHLSKGMFDIHAGNVLVRRSSFDNEGLEFYAVFENPFDALRCFGVHVPLELEDEAMMLRLSERTLDWAIRQSWTLGARSGAESLEAYSARMRETASSLTRSRDENKRAAYRLIGRAADPLDSKGRTNFSAIEHCLWAAEDRVQTRLAANRRVSKWSPSIYWILVWVVDQAVLEAARFAREPAELGALLAKESRSSHFNAEKWAVRLENIAASMGRVSVAPFGTIGLPRCARVLHRVARDLRVGNIDAARVSLDLCARAFRMIDARCQIEKALTSASFVMKMGMKRSEREIAEVVREIDAVIAMLRDDGGFLDRGFTNPQIESFILPKLQSARAAAQSPDGYQAKTVCDDLRSAASIL